ncbi:MAG: hypothetical protein KC547_13695 [Anaerolineae bacterium]|nr:hypothetical protein [Anaerolineae bacterium]
MMIKRYTLLTSILGVMLCAAILLIQPMSAVFSQGGEEYDMETLRLVEQIREETAAFRDVNNAIDAGYSPFLDCVSSDTEGGMGQHYVNAELVGDGMVDPLRPEVLVYEPLPDGSLILVALDYLVPLALWEEADPPVLFGQPLHENTDITAKYSEAKPAWILHLWIGTHNPSGMLTDYNPTVSCPDDM